MGWYRLSAKAEGLADPGSARVTAITAVRSALTHCRCDKGAWTVTDALKEISNGRGRHFDLDAANSAFIKDCEVINRELRGVGSVLDVRR